jgi:transposase
MQAKENGNDEDIAGAYPLEFKQEAVRLVAGGQSIAAAARSLGVVEQTLFNWVKAELRGQAQRR